MTRQSEPLTTVALACKLIDDAYLKGSEAGYKAGFEAGYQAALDEDFVGVADCELDAWREAVRNLEVRHDHE